MNTDDLMNEIAQLKKENAELKLRLGGVSKCNCETPNPNEGFIDSRVKRLCYTCMKDI